AGQGRRAGTDRGRMVAPARKAAIGAARPARVRKRNTPCPGAAAVRRCGGHARLLHRRGRGRAALLGVPAGALWRNGAARLVPARILPMSTIVPLPRGERPARAVSPPAPDFAELMVTSNFSF